MSGQYLSRSSNPVLVRPNRSIGGLVMDVTVEETHVDELEICEHPIENGADVVDHAFLLPSGLTIQGGQSDSGGAPSGDRRSVIAYQALLDLQGNRELLQVVTGKRSYQNMLIRSLSVTTDKETENVLLFTAELREVLLVTAQAVSVPRSRQKNGHKTGKLTQSGQKQLTKRETPSSGIFNLFGR